MELDIKDYVLLEDDKSGEVAFSIVAEVLNGFMIDDCYAWTNAKYKTEKTLFILDKNTEDKITIYDVPEETIDLIVRSKKIFLTTVQNDKIQDCWVIPAHRMLKNEE